MPVDTRVDRYIGSFLLCFCIHAGTFLRRDTHQRPDMCRGPRCSPADMLRLHRMKFVRNEILQADNQFLRRICLPHSLGTGCKGIRRCRCRHQDTIFLREKARGYRTFGSAFVGHDRKTLSTDPTATTSTSHRRRDKTVDCRNQPATHCRCNHGPPSMEVENRSCVSDYGCLHRTMHCSETTATTGSSLRERSRAFCDSA